MRNENEDIISYLDIEEVKQITKFETTDRGKKGSL